MIALKQITPCPSSVYPADSESSAGGIIFLEVVEMKEEICFEKQELDYLYQEQRQEQRSRDMLHHALQEADELLVSLKEMQDMYNDLEEEIEMLASETAFIDAKNSELKEEIQRLLVEKGESQPQRRSSVATPPSQSEHRKTCRYLRHQKRRWNCSQRALNTSEEETMHNSIRSLESILEFPSDDSMQYSLSSLESILNESMRSLNSLTN